MEIDTTRSVRIDYTNWQGERRYRFIIPMSIKYKTTEQHIKPEWLLYAYDLEKRDYRYFSIANIHDWKNN